MTQPESTQPESIPAAPAPDRIQALERASALLDLLATAGREMSVSELASASALALPTVHRILRTLVACGLARQLPSRHYGLGPRLIALGDAASRLLGAWARPHLRSVVALTGETANMAMLDGDEVVYVAQMPSSHSVRMFTDVGRHAPAHSTGVGKALLAQLPPATVRKVLRRTGMPQQTVHTTTDPEVLVAELQQIRSQGFAVDDGEQELGVRCVAVPVLGAPSNTAISVSGPEGRLTRESVTRVAPVLQRVAAELSAELTTSSSSRAG